MALTKERKILIAVAGVACGIFLLDRVLMGGTMSGPAQANAAGPAVPPVPAMNDNAPAPDAFAATSPTTQPATFQADLTTTSATSTSLAQRLSRAGRHLPDTTPNAFRPSAHWQAPPEPVDEPVVLSESFDPKAFARRHRLDAVYASPQGAYAMVNGQALREGEVREGMTLTEIGDRWVVWAGHDLRVRVRLDPVR